ncbi:Putative predicted metal-dependent hydrolase [hydrothermal vent metagenome]|uniref:Putative predicted metal-dependent hydrolase n=1 Tax=hydrothermal vent metagenome TaxID=652676 RepID=A0A1W1BRV3_9ZZZZ
MNIEIIKKDVKHFNLKVKPNGEVILTAPTNSNKRDIEYILKKRANWIDRQIAFFDEHREIYIKEYVSGENFCYLGRNYRLKVIESQDEEVKLQKYYLQIFVKDRADYTKKQQLIKEWYLQKAKIHFQKAIAKYKPIVKKEITTIRIKEMRTRWGSCNPAKGYINLNLKLIEKPTECIEYVVFHELAHLIHPNHSVKFYNYLSLYMPDWKRRKERLEAFQ